MPTKAQSILLAGAAAGVAASLSSLIPTVGDCLACILYIVAGMIAVWHYTDGNQLTMKAGPGLALGAMAGVAAALILTVLDRLFVAMGVKPDWREEMQQGFQQSGMDPAQIDQLTEWFSSPFALVVMILVGLVISAVAGGIGGAIGANVFKKGEDAGGEG